MSIDVKIMKNGPALIMHNGETLAICRCSQSEDRLTCDGSHVACGFDGPETVLTLGKNEDCCDDPNCCEPA